MEPILLSGQKGESRPRYAVRRAPVNFNEVSFEYAAGTVNQLPVSDLPEIVFSGHSNVGKSSLLNKLVQRKALARVSAQPGKTATINFYRLQRCRFVDLPGYGYAQAGQKGRL